LVSLEDQLGDQLVQAGNMLGGLKKFFPAGMKNKKVHQLYYTLKYIFLECFAAALLMVLIFFK